MKFASTRLIAADMKAMVSFYEMVTGADRGMARPCLCRNRHAGGHAGDRCC